MVANQLSESEQVTVHIANGMLQAVSMKDILERTGIPVTLDYDSIPYLPGAMTALCGEVRVSVPRHLSDQAIAILTARSPAGEIFGL